MSPLRTADYYCRREDHIEGPYTREELQFLADRGQLAPDDAIREGANGSWTTTRSIGMLFSRQKSRPNAVVSVPGRVLRRPADQRPDANGLPAKDDRNGHVSPLQLTDADFADVAVRGDHNEHTRGFTGRQKLLLSVAAALLITILGLLIWWLLSHTSGTSPGTGGGTPGQGIHQGFGPEKPASASGSAGPGRQERDAASGKSSSGRTTPVKPQQAPTAPPRAGGGAGTAGSGRYAIGGGRFFGVQAKGSRFVYVIDCSGSMEGARFRTVKHEMLRSIHALWPTQEFYVIFFAAGAYPMFTPQRPARALLPAKPANLQRVQRWVTRFPIVGGTDPTDAMVQALGLNPDAIFLLTDGEFDSPAVAIETIRKKNTHHVIINTIGLENSDGEASLRQIARESGGGYRFVR